MKNKRKQMKKKKTSLAVTKLWRMLHYKYVFNLKNYPSSNLNVYTSLIPIMGPPKKQVLECYCIETNGNMVEILAKYF